MKLIQGGQKPGQGQGKGGVERGPGEAPLTLSEQESQLGTKNSEGIKNDDLSRATPGDNIGLADSKHELDKTAKGGQAAGSAATGSGGEQVWKESLTPEEKAVLKRFFSEKEAKK